MKSLFFLLTGCFAVISLSAQTLTVRIVDQNEQPIPSATVFIRETSHGMIADSRGEFQTKISAGNYTFEISSLGFEPKTMQVTIPTEDLTLVIQLKEKVIALQEVIVTPGKEDPALRVMRQVIAHAPYHFRQVKSYESDVYFKGTFMIEKIPALIKSQINDKSFISSIGKLLVYESQSEIKYTAPNNYEQRVIALSSTIPESFGNIDRLPLNVLAMNIYHPQANGGLLGPGAFSVYDFKFEEVFNENNHTVYKIRIIPRKNNPQLVNGWLHIVENTWTVQQAMLEKSNVASSVRYSLNYHEIKPGAFLPISSDINMEMNALGIKGGGHFLASMKYNNLATSNESEAKTDSIIDNQAITAQQPPTAKQQKNLQKIEELAAKEKLTNREASKMAKLVGQSLETPEMIAAKRRLERRPIDSMVTRDSLALLRDSSFWDQVRIQPLSKDELQSYIQYDSLRLVTDSLKRIDSLRNRTVSRWMLHLLMGEQINLGKKYYLKYDGLLSGLADYNFVDGYRIGQRIAFGVNLDKNSNSWVRRDANAIVIGPNVNASHALTLSPAVYYTTARKQVDFTIDGTLNYAPLRLGKLSQQVTPFPTLPDEMLPDVP